MVELRCIGRKPSRRSPSSSAHLTLTHKPCAFERAEIWHAKGRYWKAGSRLGRFFESAYVASIQARVSHPILLKAVGRKLCSRADPPSIF